MKPAIPRLISFYLPQFHPIKENNEWWGPGFTEWTNTAKAKPLYPGHYQPHVPADLGFYDLRVAETRADQANLARAYGIEGFCYYHYWFGNGRRLLERPFNEVLASGDPDFPFCLCWANDTWSGIWYGEPKRVLMQQEYPGAEDDQKHFDSLLPAFMDPRHMRVDGKPIFIVWRPFAFPDPSATVERYRSMAAKAGLPGLHLIGMYSSYNGPSPEEIGYDASIHNTVAPLRQWGSWKNPVQLIYHSILRKLGMPTVYSYQEAIKHFLPEALPETRHPSVIHAWDNTPRSGANGLVFRKSSPSLFRVALRKAFDLTRNRDTAKDKRLIFLKSWNEWAEGNHLEPDLRNGHGYLEAVRDELAHETNSYCTVEQPHQP